MSSRKKQTQHHSSRKKNTRRKSVLTRRWGMIGAVLVIVLIVAVIIAFNQNQTTPLEISVDQAYQYYQDGVIFVDVREQSEWDTFHIPDTTLIPLGELPDRLSELPNDQFIVVICNSGNRSQQGRDILLNAGFTKVTSVQGGVQAWSAAGYPIEGTRP